MTNALDSIAITLQNSTHDYLHDPRICWVIGITIGYDAKTMSIIQAKHAWSEQSVKLLRILREDYENRRLEGELYDKLKLRREKL